MPPSSETLDQGLFKFSTDCVGQAIREAFSELKRDVVISIWADDITKTAARLAETYNEFTKRFYASVLCDAVEKYAEHYTLVHHLIPSADRLSTKIVRDAITTYSYCDNLCKVVMDESKKDLRSLAQLNKVEEWANGKSSEILKAGIIKFNRKEFGRHSKFSTSSNGYSGPDDPCRLYADLLVSDLFSGIKPRDVDLLTVGTSSNSDKSKSSNCGSCESISSGLLSPHSTADSSGLYHFADKLLYSLSALEKGSNESISSTETTDSKYSIVDCYRRSSAPELRVSSRKSSLKTVFEEMPVECPETISKQHQKTKLYPSTSLGRRLRSSEERRCASMENIDGTSSKSSYSETLAKEIIFSVYKDII